jgi:acyl dehydratase
MSQTDSRPLGARVSLDMVGSSTGEQPVAWSERDSMLYAVGVGAGSGDAARELAFTTENTGGVTLQPIPSFLTVLAVGQPPALAELDVGRFLHAGQGIELTRPLPPSGHGTVESKVVEVLDKGSGAIVTYDAVLRRPGVGAEAIGRTRTRIFIRGGGGFGGPRNSAKSRPRGTTEASQSRPQRPDFSIAYATRPEQALIYRLSGDRHRLHSDPSFARERGFERPILHGLCTFGYACRALVEGAAGGDPRRLLAMEARFAKPVYPGETLTTEIWIEAPGQVWFHTSNEASETVLDGGSARISV